MMNSARDSRHGYALYSRAAPSPFVQHLVGNCHKGVKEVGLTSLGIRNFVVSRLTRPI